jgi:hypothetical protein
VVNNESHWHLNGAPVVANVRGTPAKRRLPTTFGDALQVLAD